MTTTARVRGLIEARLGSGAATGILAAIAALTASLTLAMSPTFRVPDGVSHPGLEALDPLGVVLLVLAAVPLVAWSRSPLGVFAATAVATTLAAALGYRIGFPIAPTVALYFLAASRNETRPWTPAMTATVIGLLVAYLMAAAGAADRFPGIELTHTGLAWAAAWFAGDRARIRHEQLAELRDRAARTERDAERERLLAVAEERARIARDLHDSAGHAVNVIAVRAGAARLRHDQEPRRAGAALEAIEELARQTVDEIDHIVGALRDRPAASGTVETPPGLVSFGHLVAHHAATGLDVTVETTGAPRTLSAPADQAAYRILQEALTNAARYGSGAVQIELRFGESAVDLDVTNPVNRSDEPRSGGGHGIVGMRERATLLGGALVAERSNGTFRVHARIPYADHSR